MTAQFNRAEAIDLILQVYPPRDGDLDGETNHLESLDDQELERQANAIRRGEAAVKDRTPGRPRRSEGETRGQDALTRDKFERGFAMMAETQARPERYRNG